jgi:hypothetical protein
LIGIPPSLLRRAMVNPEREPLCGVVEADETIVPCPLR